MSGVTIKKPWRPIQIDNDEVSAQGWRPVHLYRNMTTFDAARKEDWKSVMPKPEKPRMISQRIKDPVSDIARSGEPSKYQQKYLKKMFMTVQETGSHRSASRNISEALMFQNTNGKQLLQML